MASNPLQLVSLEEAKDHVHVEQDVTDYDDDIDLKISMASSIVMEYMGLDDYPDDWMITVSPLEVDVPFKFKAATLLILGELYMNREASTANLLSDPVRALLGRRPPFA